MNKLETIKKKEYQCAYCKGVFEKGWSDEEAKAEALEAFGKPVDEWRDEAMLVCDDCYQKMLPADHSDAVAHAKTLIKLISIAAHVIVTILYPAVFAVDDENDEDKDAAFVMKSLIE